VIGLLGQPVESAHDEAKRHDAEDRQHRAHDGQEAITAESTHAPRFKHRAGGTSRSGTIPFGLLGKHRILFAFDSRTNSLYVCARFPGRDAGRGPL